MNGILDRIAVLQARIETLNRPSTVADITTVATPANDFSKVLASAQRSSATGATFGGTDVIGSLTGSGGVDTTSFAALSRLLQTSKSGSLALTGAVGGIGATAAGALPAAYDEYAASINQVATDEGVPTSLLAALVWSESSFNPDAESSAGARGLAQLMPATAAGLGVDIDNPVDNLRGGARYLRQMLDRFGSVELALAAYNAGPGAVTRANGIPDYPETQNYVTKVMARAATLAGAVA